MPETQKNYNMKIYKVLKKHICNESANWLAKYKTNLTQRNYRIAKSIFLHNLKSGLHFARQRWRFNVSGEIIKRGVLNTIKLTNQSFVERNKPVLAVNPVSLL
jgi:hypothetical protein